MNQKLNFIRRLLITMYVCREREKERERERKREKETYIRHTISGNWRKVASVKIVEDRPAITRFSSVSAAGEVAVHIIRHSKHVTMVVLFGQTHIG